MKSFQGMTEAELRATSDDCILTEVYDGADDCDVAVFITTFESCSTDARGVEYYAPDADCVGVVIYGATGGEPFAVHEVLTPDEAVARFKWRIASVIDGYLGEKK